MNSGPRHLVRPVSIIDGYALELLDIKGPISKIRSYVLRRLAKERGEVAEKFDEFDGKDLQFLQGNPVVAGISAGCAERIDELIGSEGECLRQGIVEPQLAWFLIDLHARIVEVLGNQQVLERAKTQQKEIEYIHSQQLAVVLAPIIGNILNEYFSDGQTVHLSEIGAKNGDLFGRIVYEISKFGRGALETNAYDLTPEPSLIPDFAEKYDQPNCSHSVSEANLLDINGSIPHPIEVLVLSNILHKIDPAGQPLALKEALEKLSPGGIVVLNTPFFSEVDDTTLLETFYQICDHTEYKDALLSWQQWKALSEEAGFEIVKEVDLGFKASLLDGFRHRTLILRKPIN